MKAALAKDRRDGREILTHLTEQHRDTPSTQLTLDSPERGNAG